jgi:hypothetical protein
MLTMRATLMSDMFDVDVNVLSQHWSPHVAYIGEDGTAPDCSTESLADPRQSSTSLARVIDGDRRSKASFVMMT